MIQQKRKRVRAMDLLTPISDVCPYRHLEAFTEADTVFFFGRERIIDEMVNSLREESRFLAVLGPSGCGKSSVVQAGLVPSLRRGAVDGSDRWEMIVTRPTNPSFASLLMTVSQTQHTHVTLIIDQFEELFVTSDSAANLDRVDRLLACLDHSSHVSIVVVLRDDFYSRFVQRERLARWLKRGLVNISPILTRDEVASIIQEPAHAAGLRLEEGLVEIILADVLDRAFHTEEHGRVVGSTVLPFLEFALTQLWEYRQDGTMTRDAYEATGRVAGGIAQWAHQTYSRFDTKQQLLARRIFTDLVYVGDEEQSLPVSRRRRELLSLFRSEAEQAEVSSVVQQLVTARLLTTSQDTKSGKETVEIIHDTLLREWGPLKHWMTEDRSFLLWHQKPGQSVQEWRATDAGDPPSPGNNQLFTGRDVAAARDWQTERREDLGQPEQDFIEASKEQQEQEERSLQKLNEKAVRQRQAVLARGLAAQAEQLHDEWDDLLQRRVLLALEAVRRFPHPETVQALSNGLARLRRRLVSLVHEGEVTAVSFSPDGNLLATACLDGLIGIWQFASEQQVSTFTHEGGVIAVVFSSSGYLLASIGNDNSVNVWDINSGSQLASFPHEYRVIAVAFSPDDRFLAAISGGIVEVWDVSSGQFLTSPFVEDTPVAVTFGSDGHLLVASDSGRTVQIWNATKQSRVAGFVHKGHASTAILSPDRRFLATVSEKNNRVDVWDTSSGRHVISLSHRQRVTSVAFSAGGRVLAIATLSRIVGIWDLSNGHRLASLLHQEVVTGVTFSPDGLLLATACLVLSSLNMARKRVSLWRQSTLISP
jgi:energy-coupling factor transporter ATP-binding protein EcfA2